MVEALEFAVPDGIEPIVGWRYWRGEDLNGRASSRAWLASLNKFQTWPPGRALEARCSLEGGHPDPPPGIACGCGIYAATDRATLQELANPDLQTPLVVGEVALWGRVVPAELGYRAQFAYPRRLWVVRESLAPTAWLDDLPAALAASYGVPVGSCDARWAVSVEAMTTWPMSPAASESRTAVVSFKRNIDRLAGALMEGEDAYRAELGRMLAEDETIGLARNALRDPPS
jgi:hypothetical protein